MFCWKKFHVLWYFTSNFVCQKLVLRENLKIFQCFAGCCCCCCSFFFLRFFCFFRFCSMWKVVRLQLWCSCCFFFFFLKFLVGMSSLFRVFIHVFGVNKCGVWRFYRRGSPMWGLKVFSVEVTNVVFKRFLFFFFASGLTNVGFEGFLSSGFTNVGFKRFLGSRWLRARLCCRKISDSIFWLFSFTPRWLGQCNALPKEGP